MTYSIKKTAEDRAGLPAALLPLAKTHMRVDWNYDDAFITSAIGRACDWFSRVTGITLFETTYEWKPDAADFYQPRAGIDPAAVPFSPVADDWTATAGGVDVKANYDIVTASVHGVELYRLIGSYADGLTLTINSGYATPDDMPGGILDAVLRYTAHLYEHREILLPDREAAVPGWMTDVIATYWMPRA